MENLKKYSILIFIILIVLVLSYTIKIPELGKEISKVKFENGVEVSVEVADSDEERQQGLMFLENLDKNSGMLFVYGEERMLSFWMKNTLINLDIIFIDSNLEIVDIIETMVPCENNQECVSYPSNFPSKYALEVNSGFVKENNIKVGEKVVLNI